MPADRFSRQERFAAIGADGQQRLRDACALIVGVGALGTHVADALARAGVGHLHLVDRDIVELHNLQRQVLFTEADADAGAPKAVAAAERLATVHSGATYTPHVLEFQADTLAGLAPRPQVLIDGTDNFATRYLLNDLAVANDLPWLYGGVLGSEGLAMAVVPGVSPCLRCLMPAAPAAGDSGTCETDGVLAPAVATVAAFQTAQALKLLSGHADSVVAGMLAVDVWRGTYAVRFANARPVAGCATCDLREFPALAAATAAAGAPAVALCGRDAVQVRPAARGGVDLDRLAERLRPAVEDLQRTPHLLRFAADRCRFSVFPDGRALLFGLRDPNRALALYDRWIGGR